MKPKLALLAILLLGLVLRSYRLADFPAGFNPDEASFGYDAYSLLKTGHDHWGQPWPLTFRSFGDFKLPLYTYIAIPSLAIFGLNEFAVRLPSALFGTLAILATFFFTKELFAIKSPLEKPGLSDVQKAGLFQSQSTPILAAFLLATSPWHISLSRGSIEANLTSFFLPLGLYFLLKGIQMYRLKAQSSFLIRNSFFVISGLLLGLNMYSYHGARLFTPLMLIATLVWYYLARSHNPKTNRPTLMIYIIRVLPLLAIIMLTTIPIFFTFFNQSASRVSDIGIFNPTDHWQTVADRRWQAVQQGLPSPVPQIFNNKATYLVERFTENYLSYFSPQFLLTQGPNDAWYGMIPGRGVLNWIDIPLILIAIIYFIKKPSKSLTLILLWVALAPLPASLAKGPSAAHRAATILPAIHILSAYGFITLLHTIPKTLSFSRLRLRLKLKLTLVLVLVLISTGSLLFFLEDYFLHAPLINAPAMSYGWHQFYRQLEPVQDNYQQIIISTHFSEPQIFTAFYQQLDPRQVQLASQDWLRYQAQHLSFLDQLDRYHLGKFTYRHIHYPEDQQIPHTLLVDYPENLLTDINPLIQINYPISDKSAIIAIETHSTDIQ